MTLPASGEITLNDVNVELGNTGTDAITIGSADVRDLFGVASGEITMADGYGKSSVYSIDNSCRFDGASMLEREFVSAGTSTKIWTISVWAKVSDKVNRSLFHNRTGPSTAGSTTIFLQSGGKFRFQQYGGPAWDWRKDYSGVHRDYSAWYHFVFVYDSTESVENDRLKIYRNGVHLGDPSHTYDAGPTLNEDCGVSSGGTDVYIGANMSGTNWDGYMAEYHFIDGTALTPSSFGETGDYGEWKPKEVSGLTYGDNGFYLNFSNASDLGEDFSGNDNDFTATGLTTHDQMPDTPTNNFATFNPLFEGGESSSSIYADTTLSEGSLKSSVPTNSYMGATIRPESGAWYSEFLVSTVTNEVGWGWLNAPDYSSNTANAGIANKWGGYYHGYAPADLRIYDETSQLGSDIALTISNGDILQLAWDIDNNKGYIGINDTWYAADNGTDGNPSAGTNQTFTFTATEATNLQPYIANGASTAVFVANFGQDSSFAGAKTAQSNQDSNGIGDFYYTPPTDFLALCTSNLPDPTVTPSEHFNTLLYTGTGSSNRNITGTGFNPDFNWLKMRNDGDNHVITDVMRGTNHLHTNTTSGDSDAGHPALITDGFQVSSGNYNNSGKTFVAWQWKANGSGSSNTDGDITSTVSANVDAGFSIVSWVGTDGADSVGHGLDSAVELLILKNRSRSSTWRVHHNISGLTNGRMDLELTTATNTANHQITFQSDTFTFESDSGAHEDWNESGEDIIAYCFHSVEGFSRCGKYEGNADADGPFVYTGFRPMWVMAKCSSHGSEWKIYDSKRNTHNVMDEEIRADSSNAANVSPYNYLDFLSNGFKPRVTDHPNQAKTYIYIAFAEQPFKHTNAR